MLHTKIPHNAVATFQVSIDIAFRDQHYQGKQNVKFAVSIEHKDETNDLLFYLM